jgi:hypothetical protein
MSSLPYSNLNESQRARIAYLFADDAFGTDVRAYLYEVDKQGNVTGRTAAQPTAPKAMRAKQFAPVIVTTAPEVNVTDELIQHASMSMDALAAFVADKLFQKSSILEEVKS